MLTNEGKSIKLQSEKQMRLSQSCLQFLDPHRHHQKLFMYPLGRWAHRGLCVEEAFEAKGLLGQKGVSLLLLVELVEDIGFVGVHFFHEGIEYILVHL